MQKQEFFSDFWVKNLLSDWGQPGFLEVIYEIIEDFDILSDLLFQKA